MLRYLGIKAAGWIYHRQEVLIKDVGLNRNMAVLSKEYYEGQKHYYQNGDDYNNHYPLGTQRHDDFERGYFQAQRKGGALDVRAIKSPLLGKRAVQTAEREERQRKKKAYMKAKGLL